jgi:hypothetical protein
MDLQAIHKRIELILNKDTGKYFTHEEIDDLLDMAQMDEFNNLLGNTRGTSPLGLGKSQGISEELLPFETFKLLQNGDRNQSIGVNTYDLPTDVMYITLITKNGASVDLMSKHEVSARLDSEIIPPTAAEPVAMFYSQSGVKRLRVYPSSVTDIDVFYLKRPAAPEFVYTLNGRQVVYDQASSTQMLWNDRSIEHIIKRACALAGVNLAAPDVTQYNEQKQQTGL